MQFPKIDINVQEGINPGEQLSGDRWAEAAGVTFARSWTPAMLHLAVQRGEDEFIRIARPILAGHGFTQRHYKRMFEIIKRTAELNPVHANDPNIEYLKG